MKKEIYLPIQRDQLRELYTLEEPHKVELKPVSQRTVDQNSKLWPMATDISKQVEWYGQKLNKDDWVKMFLAALYKDRIKAVPGLDGGFVTIGLSSRGLTINECSDVIEMMYAFGAEHNVIWKGE